MHTLTIMRERTAMLTCHSFQYIIRLLNTNVDGKQKVMYALTKIKGVGRRYSNLVCKKADVDLSKRYALGPWKNCSTKDWFLIRAKQRR